MKCPKCGYLGFEHVDRCRNCGYDFSLSASPTLADFSIRPDGSDDLGPLDDLSLAEPSTRHAPLDTSSAPLHRSRPSAGSRADATPSDLPLFARTAPDDAPLITRVPPPRPPLAVRRATPDVPRLRAESRSAPLDQPLPDLGEFSPGYERPAAPIDRASTGEFGDARTGEAAAVFARVVAAAIDLVMLLGIDLVVVYFTLQISGLTFDDLAILPKAPLAAFLMLLGLSYFVVFTMGGQTLGQMTVGVRVVANGSAHPPDVGPSLLRTLAWFLLLAPAGMGLFSVMLDGDRRGLHDRLAATRVVRAGP